MAEDRPALQKPSKKETVAEIAIVVLLLFGRLVFHLFTPPGLSGDGFGYVSVARTLINSGKLLPLTTQPHGYPILIVPLLASGLDIARAVLLMNALLDCSVVALLLWTVKCIFPERHNRRLLVLAWLLVAVQPFTAEMVVGAYTETPSIFLTFFGAWFLFMPSNQGAKLLGFGLLGVASLLRTDNLLLNVAAIITYLFLFHRKALDVRYLATGLVVFCAFPVSMLAFQYYSTQEIGMVREADTYGHAGYYAWMRGWFAIEKTEHDRFAFDVGTANWAGFDVANYPSRAFDSTGERDRVAELLATWRATSYTAAIDRGFRRLGIEKFQDHPVRSLVLIPFLRMLHYWINIDGAQTYLRVVPLRRPFSTFVVGLVILLRLVLICLAIVGTYYVWLGIPATVTKQVLFARFASLLVLFRTLEFGILGIVAMAGLMEVRFILVAVPFALILSAWGIRFLARAGNWNRHGEQVATA
jgi:hypothetical protein